MDGWNTSFLLGKPIFRGYFSFGEEYLRIPNKSLGFLVSKFLWLQPSNKMMFFLDNVFFWQTVENKCASQVGS